MINLFSYKGYFLETGVSFGERTFRLLEPSLALFNVHVRCSKDYRRVEAQQEMLMHSFNSLQKMVDNDLWYYRVGYSFLEV
jgi:hypothetical protein